MITSLRHCDNENWCDRPNHSKCQLILNVLKEYSNNKKITLFFYSNVLSQHLSLNPVVLFPQHLGILCSANLNNHYIMGGNLNCNELARCENWKIERKIWRRLHRYGFTDYMEKLHGSKNFVSHGFAKGWRNNKVTLFG